ncbi:hypothetical protein EYF80_038819 [Liparis tanakae]|uniref:Uncharacterized protein n=1 Tax=Liparis tanakae TaxID=230148 RepID=A0A4Z2GBM9_9TELE|nr:hypothetical protein EYF80_038819 [Liparis tanakae]
MTSPTCYAGGVANCCCCDCGQKENQCGTPRARSSGRFTPRRHGDTATATRRHGDSDTATRAAGPVPGLHGEAPPPAAFCTRADRSSLTLDQLTSSSPPSNRLAPERPRAGRLTWACVRACVCV